MALYYSFVYPYLMYCNHIWGSTYKTNLRRLVILQNKVVRIISHVKPRNSAGPLYKALNIMKFEDTNTFLIGNFMYRHSQCKVPELFYFLWKTKIFMIMSPGVLNTSTSLVLNQTLVRQA